MAKNPDDPLALIRKRKAAIAAAAAKEREERARADAARAKEAEELAIAEKVFARLANESAPKADHAPAQKKAAPTKDGTPRPEGIPTVAEMVTELLLEAEVKGLRGLTRSEIMAGIDARWWPGVAVNMVIPTMYKSMSKGYWFKKEGKLFIRLRGGQPPKRHAQLKLVS